MENSSVESLSELNKSRQIWHTSAFRSYLMRGAADRDGLWTQSPSQLGIQILQGLLRLNNPLHQLVKSTKNTHAHTKRLLLVANPTGDPNEIPHESLTVSKKSDDRCLEGLNAFNPT